MLVISKRFLSSSMLAVATLVTSTNIISPEPDRNELNSNQSVAKRDLSSLDKYRKLIKFEDDKKDEILNGKICRVYLPRESKGKPLYVLVLGHTEELDFSPDYSGTMHFYERLKKEDKGIVLLFRTGLATDEIVGMFSSEYKPQYEPKTVFKQTKEIIQDFITNYEPKELRLSGFSWGGSTVAQLAEEDSWRQSVPVMRTVMIDPISFGSFRFGTALRTRPEFKNSPEHKNFHIYQRNENLSVSEWLTTIQGNFPIKLVKDKEGKTKIIRDERPGDVIWHVPNTSHLALDDINDVRLKAYEFLTAR